MKFSVSKSNISTSNPSILTIWLAEQDLNCQITITKDCKRQYMHTWPWQQFKGTLILKSVKDVRKLKWGEITNSHGNKVCWYIEKIKKTAKQSKRKENTPCRKRTEKQGSQIIIQGTGKKRDMEHQTLSNSISDSLSVYKNNSVPGEATLHNELCRACCFSNDWTISSCSA